MNQQERDRLWSEHHRGAEQNQFMQKQDFTAALQEATAQARREALEEAARMAKERAENASATALKLHADKKLPEGTRAVYRALYLHFTSLANTFENMTVEGALAAHPENTINKEPEMTKTAKQQNSEAAIYRINTFLDGTAHECSYLSHRDVLWLAVGFIEGAELSGLITLAESDDFQKKVGALAAQPQEGK